MIPEAQGDERFLSMAAVRDLVGGFSRVHVYRLMRRGQFPAAVKIGGRSVWVESEVREWMRARVAERDAVRRERELEKAMARPGDEAGTGRRSRSPGAARSRSDCDDEDSRRVEP